jgi:hypothetical protein
VLPWRLPISHRDLRRRQATDLDVCRVTICRRLLALRNVLVHEVRSDKSDFLGLTNVHRKALIQFTEPWTSHILCSMHSTRATYALVS